VTSVERDILLSTQQLKKILARAHALQEWSLSLQSRGVVARPSATILRRKKDGGCTIPCEPNTAHKVKGKPYFAVHIHVLSTLCTLGLKVLQRSRTFLWALFKFPSAKNYG